MRSKSLIIMGVALTLVGMTLAGCPKNAALKVSVNTMHFGVTAGPPAEYETVKTFQVWNDGAAGTSVVFNVTAQPAWLTVNPTTGQSHSAADKVTITVTVNRDYAAKALDFINGSITVDAGTQKQTIAVTNAPDYFTQAFSATKPIDLDQMQLLFTPNGGPNYYGLETSAVTEFPTDPAGGLLLDFGAYGDPVQASPFGGEVVPFYGKNYSTLYISSQGWVSFGEPGANPNSYANHFKAPQISGLGINAAQSGDVSFLQDADKLIITYENCPTAGTTASLNDFQIELFFDGRIRVSYLNVDPAMQGVIGLSYGMGATGGLPADFLESDLNTNPLKAN